MTDIKVDLISEMDEYLMVDKGIRGGMTQVSLKHVKANNQYMKSYDKDKPSTYVYLVANSLHGLAMSKLLPCADLNGVRLIESKL